jgi:hypothetical protein
MRGVMAGLVGAVTVMACGEGDPGGLDALHLSLMPDSVTISVGERYRFEAVAADGNGRPVHIPITYATSDSAVFRVDSLGNIVGQAAGVAQLIADGGTAEDHATVTVLPSPTGWTDVERGCGIYERRLYCWEIAPSTTPTPIQIMPAVEFVAISAGALHHCAVDVQRRLWCWGSNRLGQLGMSGVDSSDAPVRVASGISVRDVYAGPYNTCITSDDQSLLCWGANTAGQLGAATTEVCGAFRIPCSRVPMRFELQGQVVSVALGGDIQTGDPFEGSAHICAVVTSGVAYCSGDGGFGQLGNGSLSNSDRPRQVLGGSSYDQIVAGESHTCAIVASSRLAECWGINARGELGVGSFPAGAGEACRYADIVWECISRPIAVNGPNTFRQISASLSTTCGATTFSKIMCWGEGRFGQLGDGVLHTSAPYGSFVPVYVESTSSFAKVESDGALVCGITAGSALYCWGNGTAQPRLISIP